MERNAEKAIAAALAFAEASPEPDVANVEQNVYA